MSSASRCRFCDHENPNDARFCNACGSPLHLKPCPQCESVNDVAAAQCYECGAPLDIGAPVETDQASITVAAAPITEASENAEPRHVPEAFGARLGDLPPLEGHENVTAAERRDAFMRRSRASAAAFALLVFLVIGAFGYYAYQHRPGSEPAVVAASAQTENQREAAQPQPAAPTPNESTDAPAGESPNAQTASSGTLTSDAASNNESTTSETEGQTPPSSDAKQPTTGKAVARYRSASPRSSAKADTPYSRPAPATDASAQATQRMIERYLGTRAGTSTPRSNQY